MNLLELYESTKKFSMRRADYAQNQNWTLKSAIPYAGTKSLLFQAECFGQTVETIHTVNIMFSKLDFREEPVKNADMKEIEYKGQTYYLNYPTVETECTVRCSCPDFTYRFAFADWKAKCLFGSKPKKYIRKTKTRPPVNPDQIAGMCKHVYQMQSLLKAEGYMK